ncbi:MAG: polysaccharide biosynthesis/export family protein [Planctomycetaceae bacterium]|nr:polysaccharide biosynthesis/export family protein [Planctomycetaceae bacterium]
MLAGCMLAIGPGCRAIDFYTLSLQATADVESPRELSMVSLPAYRIEPPDVVRLEVLKAVPQPTYRLGAFDLVLVRTVGVLPDRPIDGNFTIDADGAVALGPPYGSVRVVGLTTTEAAAAIRQTLQLILQNPEVTVQVLHSASAQQFSGDYRVEPDGVLRLHGFGEVRVAGMTVTEASRAIESQLARYFDSPRVGLEVVHYNSKSYYVILPTAGSGESVHRFPITGNETVLDAIGEVGQFSNLSSKTMWIARAAPDGLGSEQILPVNWEAIASGGETKTNYQLMPGDRLYIADDTLVSFNYYLGKLTSPVERLLGVGNLGLNTVRSSETLGRQYNSNRRD